MSPLSEVIVLAPLVPLQKKIYEFLRLLTSGSGTSQHQSLQNILVQLWSSITSVKFQTSTGHSSKKMNCTQDEENHFQIFMDSGSRFYRWQGISNISYFTSGKTYSNRPNICSNLIACGNQSSSFKDHFHIFWDRVLMLSNFRFSNIYPKAYISEMGVVKFIYIAFRNVMQKESSSQEGWGYIRGQAVVCIFYIVIWNDCFEMIMIIWARFFFNNWIACFYDCLVCGPINPLQDSYDDMQLSVNAQLQNLVQSFINSCS